MTQMGNWKLHLLFFKSPLVHILDHFYYSKLRLSILTYVYRNLSSSAKCGRYFNSSNYIWNAYVQMSFCFSWNSELHQNFFYFVSFVFFLLICFRYKKLKVLYRTLTESFNYCISKFPLHCSIIRTFHVGILTFYLQRWEIRPVMKYEIWSEELVRN